MNCSLKLSMLVALALGSSQVLAMDLGQIQIKSALGQPLLAEIPLHPASPADLQNLNVQLASSEDFARAGISGGRTAIPLHFSVARTGSGQQVIRITSSVAIDDPYLDLLIEVNGNAGKSVREFAILLDPPGTPPAAPAMAAPMAPAQTVSSQVVHATAVTPAPRHSRPATAPSRPASAANGKYGPVQRGQTLSSIAHSTAPAGVDVHQMLLALKQANPNAFYRDNINALKSGVVLRVPTATEAQAVAVAAAVAEVRRQSSDWRAGATSKPSTVADAATRASASSSPTGTSGNSGDRLALVPAKGGNGSEAGGGRAAGKGGKSAAGMRQDLLRTQESLASLQQQGTDLKTRLKDLADINDKNEHLLSLKDNEIAELQNQLAAARKTAAMPAAASMSPTRPAPAASTAGTPGKIAAATSPESKPAPVSASTSAAAAPVAPASASTAMTSTPASAASAPAVSTSAAMAAPATVAAPIEPAAKPIIRPAPVVEQPWYMQTWAWAAGAGAVVVLLLLALLGRRRKPAVAVQSKSSPSLADRFGSVPSDGIGSEDIDQDELLDQLAEHPDDIGLHLELVTLYYSRRDIEHFEAAAEAMHAHITDPQQDEWQDVMHMGEDLVPGHPLFDHHDPLPLHEETEARSAFDINDYAVDDDAAAVTSSMPPLPPQVPKKVSGYNFNFDLTSAASGAPDSDKPVVVVPVADTQHVTPAVETESSWHSNEPGKETHGGGHGFGLGEFTDDPIDTKLDLARAYLDMGDADGARAMLGEVLKEGSQMQQDTAKRLLETLR